MKRAFMFITVITIAVMLLAGCASPGVPTTGQTSTGTTSGPITQAQGSDLTTSTSVSNPTNSSAPTSSPSLPSGMGLLQVYVTDPPPPEMEVILVDVKNLQVHRTGGGWVTVDDNPGSFDLKELEGIQEYLAGKIVESGNYTQIRLEVISVNITAGGEVHPAKVPSGEIKLVGNFKVADGGTTAITLDFNGKESVIVTGNDQYIFKPVVKLLVTEPSPSSTSASSTEAEITAYSLPEKTGDATIDSVAGTINVEVAYGTDVTALTAEFTTSDDITSIQVDGVDQVSGDTSNDFSTPVTYVVTAEDGVTTKSWVVTVTVATTPQSTEAEITAYSLPEKTGDATIDSIDCTINVEVAYGTDVTALTAEFTTSDDITSIQVDGVDQVSEDTSNDFSTPVTYEVIAEDGVTTKSWVVTVTVATS